jgi:hypothetical protein
VTKKARILELLATGLTPVEVAARVDCASEYVRTVQQRQRHGGVRPCDEKWLGRRPTTEQRQKYRQRFRDRYATDEAFRNKHREISRLAGKRMRLRRAEQAVETARG